MNNQGFVSPDEIRALISSAMSAMYKSEVPLYGTLLDLVAQTNEKMMEDAPEVPAQLRWTGEIRRLSLERRGAIRVGTAAQLSTIQRLHTRLLRNP
jgi:uncharacterized glyoxalase superfamily metalloenzyme YdcJ